LYYYTNRSFPRNFSPSLSLTWWLWGKKIPPVRIFPPTGIFWGFVRACSTPQGAQEGPNLGGALRRDASQGGFCGGEKAGVQRGVSIRARKAKERQIAQLKQFRDTVSQNFGERGEAPDLAARGQILKGLLCATGPTSHAYASRRGSPLGHRGVIACPAGRTED